MTGTTLILNYKYNWGTTVAHLFGKTSFSAQLSLHLSWGNLLIAGIHMMPAMFLT